MGKRGEIGADSPHRRCRCGRIKPFNRSQCYTCRPRKKDYIALPETEEPYSLADWVAIAEACGMGYGQLMAHVRVGGVPPVKKKVRWPAGSAHKGE